MNTEQSVAEMMSRFPVRTERDQIQPGPNRCRPPICYACGKAGHLSRSCWNKISPGNGKSNDVRNPRVSSVRPNRKKQNRHAGKVCTAGYLKPAYLKMKLEDEEVFALLDTGAHVTLIPGSRVPLTKIQPTDIKLWAANKTEIRTLGVAL
jgi:hypothetical protein